MKYRKEYITTRDIDWFYRINHIWIHAASVGGELPNKVNDSIITSEIQHIVSNLPYIYEQQQLYFNETFLQQRFEKRENDEAIYNYLSSFIDMARKGFSSFDRTNLYDISDNKYHLVVRPKDEFLDGTDLAANKRLNEIMPSVQIELNILSIAEINLPTLVNRGIK